ncbi:uncharacterized protein [Diabrotica undecimpunctata]|uniref:uncharacterized protein n=1 Tax=Diabrotica undecimpunctata TaxID=50387 RepID=UPI003B637DCD
MSKKDLEKLITRKRQAVSTISRVKRFISEHKDDPESLKKDDLFSIRKDMLCESFKTITDLNTEIAHLDENFDDDIDDIEAEYVDLLATIQGVTSMKNNKITVPLVHNMPQHHATMNDSYNEALQILNNRYNNETMIINSHIYQVLDIPAMQKGTASSLREFISKVKQQIGALKNLNQPVDSWDMLLVCILSRKIDQFTNRSYQIDRDSSSLPSLNGFLKYLENRAMALEATNSTSETKLKENKQLTHLVTKSQSNVKCQYCSINGHKLYSCKKFKVLSVNERISFVDRNKLCKLCLNSHTDKCRLNLKCQTCHKGHNSLLHLEKVAVSSNIAQSNQDASTSSQYDAVVNFNSIYKNRANTILPTVKVKVRTASGHNLIVRGLVDTGSQVSLVTNSLVKRLNLKTYNNYLDIVGISQNSTRIQKAVDLNIESCIYDFSTNIKCSVVDIITGNLPRFSFNTSKIPEFVQLSDDTFNQSGEISLLLGADVVFKILLAEKINCQELILQNTLLGFIVSGSVSTNQFSNLNIVCMHTTYSDLDTAISQFWEMEKVPEVFLEFTSDQEACNSFAVALKRFENLEKRFVLNPTLYFDYKKFIDEYIQLGHAKIVHYDPKILNNGEVYFMAHHPVIREDKKTTKLRIVFDGSMKSKSKKCLNDFLYNGAVVQNELFDILILFRIYKYIISTDIKQMFRMILIHPEDRRYLNILWREPHSELKCIQLQTITYGLRSSSFLATRCLVELANTEGQNFPLAAKALINNTYVDDILAGSDTIEEAKKLKNELISLLQLRSFSLHKWCSNDPRIISDIPKENQHFDEIDINKINFVVKTLGLSYDTITDNFKLSSPKININDCLTKRQVLSFISKFYDPLGLAGPVLVKAKVIMQTIWLRKIKWDEVLPNDLQEIWKNFITGLINMPVLKIPRNLAFTDAESIELVGYCDSSMQAYGAALYARTICHDTVNVNLICSKSRIVPINKKLTIPKLELNVLAWLKTEPVKLTPYVANRVLKIQNMSTNFKWLYINSKENPADCLSRGLEPNDIELHPLWFTGPKMLLDKNFAHNELPVQFPYPMPEQKEIKDLISNIVLKSPLSTLSPFVDGDGLLRVGGRLHNSNILYTQKHPIILPKASHVTDLIIRHEHLKLLHAGPSYSPVFGGLWEAGVKSAKYHIKRVMGTNELTYEQFNTLIVQVEGILNSRPLMAMSQDPTNLEYLTPGHFLIGAPITSFPEPDITEVPKNRIKFWNLCTQMQQHFWKKWHQDYLTQLQNRPKWKNKLPNLKEDMLVLLKEDNIPSFKWALARITKVIPGKDKMVRVVEVKTKNGTYVRSVTKVAVLPFYE